MAARLQKPEYIVGDWPKKAPQATPRKVLLIRGTLAILFTKMLLLVALEGCCSSGVDLYIIKRKNNRSLENVLLKRGCC